MGQHSKSKQSSTKLQVTTYLAAGVLVSGGGAAALTGAMSAPTPAPVASPAGNVELTGLGSLLGSVVHVLISNGADSATGDGGNAGLLIGTGGSSLAGNGGSGGLILGNGGSSFGGNGGNAGLIGTGGSTVDATAATVAVDEIGRAHV